MRVAISGNWLTPARVVVTGIVLAGVTAAVGWQVLISEVGSDSISAFVLVVLVPFASGAAIVVAGLFCPPRSFVVTTVGGIAFAVFTGLASYYIYADPRVLRLIGFFSWLAPGQLVVVALTFFLCLLYAWEPSQTGSEGNIGSREGV